MSPRTGRPKSANPLNFEVKVKMDEKTFREMLDYCEKHQINRMQFLRKGIDLVLKTERKQKK